MSRIDAFLGKDIPEEGTLNDLEPVPDLVDDYRPIIGTNDELHVNVDGALAAIVEANGSEPSVFVRSRSLTKVLVDEHGRSYAAPMTTATLAEMSSRTARWVKPVKSKDGALVSAKPDMLTMQAMGDRGEWLDLPPLFGVIEAPIMRADGVVIDRRGYDPGTGLYYAPDADVDMPAIAEHPTQADVDAAVSVLDDILGEFPYTNDTSRANAYGTLISAVLRPAIAGASPLIVVNATSPGTGKSLFCSVISAVATGRPAVNVGEPGTETETEKMLGAVLDAAPALVIFDNVDQQLQSGHLARAVTSDIFSGRRLGASVMLEMPVRCTWIANGNGIELGGDLPRRAIWVDLDAQTSRPWLRTGFKHRYLGAHVHRNRGKILAAVLTLAKGWHQAGRPTPPSPELGSFEQWCETVGGILAYAGIDGFLADIDARYTDAETSDGWWPFLVAIRERYGDQMFATAALAKSIEAAQEIAAHLDDTSSWDGQVPWNELVPPELLETRQLSRALGKAFQKRAGKRYGDQNEQLHLASVKDGVRRGVNGWRVLTMEGE